MTTPPTLSAEPLPALAVKVGQMIMAGFRGLKASDAPAILDAIRTLHIGSIVLFDYDVSTATPVRNIESPQQVKTLIADLNAAAGIPLLIAIDQEGGIVNRLKEKYGFPSSVSHYFLGQQDDLTLTHHYASQMAVTLKEAGINLNLAPCVDLRLNPDNPVIAAFERSFGADPELVTRHAREFINAHHEQGVLCTLKHFPGHGSSATDSHRGMVDVSKSWQPSELEPYRQLIADGSADAIMTAHVFSPNDPDNPATLSPATLNGLLRRQLGWDGVIISDDMMMSAITSFYGLETAIQKGVDAGLDILAFANNTPIYQEEIIPQAVATLLKLVNDGTISEARIDQSYRRIQKCKARLMRA